MRVPPYLVMMAVVSAAGPLLFAAEPAKQPQQDTATKSPAQAPAAKAAETAPAEKTAQQAGNAPQKAPEKEPDKAAAAKDPKSTVDRASTPQRFVPSEEVRPDFDVSFPVDI